MRAALCVLMVMGCGSKGDAPAAGSAAPAAKTAAAAGKHPRVNGMITNSEGGELCNAMMPDSLKAGNVVSGGGEATKLTCNFKTSAGKLLRSAVMDCKPGQTLDGFKAFYKGEEVAGVGRAAFKAPGGVMFFATKADCAVMAYTYESGGDAAAFAKPLDDVITAQNTPWPEK